MYLLECVKICLHVGRYLITGLVYFQFADLQVPVSAEFATKYKKIEEVKELLSIYDRNFSVVCISEYASNLIRPLTLFDI